MEEKIKNINGRNRDCIGQKALGRKATKIFVEFM